MKNEVRHTPFSYCKFKIYEEMFGGLRENDYLCSRKQKKRIIMSNIVINAVITLVVFAVVCGVIIAVDIRGDKKVNHAAE